MCCLNISQSVSDKKIVCLQWLHLCDDLCPSLQWFLQLWALDAWMTGNVNYSNRHEKAEVLCQTAPEQAPLCIEEE
jgi:hypothetical protein